MSDYWWGNLNIVTHKQVPVVCFLSMAREGWPRCVFFSQNRIKWINEYSKIIVPDMVRQEKKEEHENGMTWSDMTWTYLKLKLEMDVEKSWNVQLTRTRSPAASSSNTPNNPMTSLKRRNSSSLESSKICTFNVSKSLKVLGCLLIRSISPAGSS